MVSALTDKLVYVESLVWRNYDLVVKMPSIWEREGLNVYIPKIYDIQVTK
jgi:hypothetical protein